jgi:hypothetical protein
MVYTARNSLLWSKCNLVQWGCSTTCKISTGATSRAKCMSIALGRTWIGVDQRRNCNNADGDDTVYTEKFTFRSINVDRGMKAILENHFYKVKNVHKMIWNALHQIKLLLLFEVGLFLKNVMFFGCILYNFNAVILRLCSAWRSLLWQISLWQLARENSVREMMFSWLRVFRLHIVPWDMVLCTLFWDMMPCCLVQTASE